MITGLVSRDNDVQYHNFTKVLIKNCTFCEILNFIFDIE